MAYINRPSCLLETYQGIRTFSRTTLHQKKLVDYMSFGLIEILNVSITKRFLSRKVRTFQAAFLTLFSSFLKGSEANKVLSNLNFWDCAKSVSYFAL